MVSEFCAPRCIVPQKPGVQKNLFPHSPEIVRLKNVIYEAHNSEWDTRFLVLLRGLPGSGKSTLGRFLVDKLDQRNVVIASNDDYFYDEVEQIYKYNNTELNEAIAACKQKVWSSICNGVSVIIVDNCNLTRLEMDPFIREGVKRNYCVHLLEPCTPWRYNAKKLVKLTHYTNISLTEINGMLTTFERALNIETILSQICLPSSSSPSLSSSMLLSNVNSSNHNSTSNISFNAISGTNDISTSNNSNELNEHVCHYTTNDDDNNLPSSSNCTSCRSNNNIDNSAIRTAITTVNFDELDPQDENWTTPTGSMEALNINHVVSGESISQDSSNSSGIMNTSPLVQQPSTSQTKLGELMAIFPNLKSNILEEFLSLAHDNVSWATTLILDNHTSERINQKIEQNLNLVENNLFLCKSTVSQTSEHPSTEVTEAALDPAPLSPTTCAPSFSNVSEDDTTNPSQATLSSVKESQSENQIDRTFNHQHGIRFSRSFLQTAHEEYAFGFGLSDIDISPDAIPDFIIDEWTPEPNLIKEIYASFMRHLGVLSNSTTNVLTPKFPPLNTRNSNQNTKKPTVTPSTNVTSKRSFSTFLQIMDDEEGLLRSVEDFRTSLNTPVIRVILNRLMSKFPGTQKNVVEEAFVRCEFDEARTEVYLLTYYKSTIESVTKSTTTTTSTVTSNLSSIQCPNNMLTVNQQSVNSTLIPNNSNNNLIGLDYHQTTGENLSLQEIQDEEEALNRSIEDQKDRLLTLANQLCLSRLKAQFPEIEINYLENLFIRFDLNEQNLSDYLIKQGFTTHSLNPFLVETVNKYIENVDNNDSRASPVSSSQGYVTDFINNSIDNTDWLNLINQKIASIRQKIGQMKNNLSYSKDNRVKQFQITEIRSLQSQLHYLELQKAEYLVDTRSSLYEDELLTNGEKPINSACLAFAYLDLHGLSKSCALHVLQQRLTYLKDKLNRLKSLKYITVITGRAAGNESDLVSIAPVLRPAVMQYLLRNGYKFEENFRVGSGHFTVNLNNSKLK
ncbi:unnamed protein product [Schistosoma rodhaini]|uniref:Smr domain-containing protein n=2 Tax=Schistosoma rodhaini TaxID=6188 RepID=A0AA85FQI7_9TREM|nr:unnamed protein product [Schistosoma rodhaini]